MRIGRGLRTMALMNYGVSRFKKYGTVHFLFNFYEEHLKILLLRKTILGALYLKNSSAD